MTKTDRPTDTDDLPPQRTVRDKAILLPVTDEERESIKTSAAHYGVSVAIYLRWLHERHQPLPVERRARP